LVDRQWHTIQASSSPCSLKHFCSQRNPLSALQTNNRISLCRRCLRNALFVMPPGRMPRLSLCKLPERLSPGHHQAERATGKRQQNDIGHMKEQISNRSSEHSADFIANWRKTPHKTYGTGSIGGNTRSGQSPFPTNEPFCYQKTQPKCYSQRTR